MAGPFAYDVFLSHNKKDAPRVHKLAERLRDAGLRVWFDGWIIQPGDDIYLAIERGLQESRTLILYLSPAALDSNRVTLERGTAIFRDPTNEDRRFIPLLLANCKLPDTLRRYKYVDYRKQGKAAFEKLVAACRTPVEAPAQLVSPSPPGTVTMQPTKRGTRTLRPVKPHQPETLSAIRERVESIAYSLGRTDSISSVAVTADGSRAVSGSSDQTIRVWDVARARCLATLEGHTDGITSVAVTADGTRVVSGSKDETVRIWDVASGHCLATLYGQTAGVLSVTVTEDGNRVFSGVAEWGGSSLELG